MDSMPLKNCTNVCCLFQVISIFTAVVVVVVVILLMLPVAACCYSNFIFGLMQADSHSSYFGFIMPLPLHFVAVKEKNLNYYKNIVFLGFQMKNKCYFA